MATETRLERGPLSTLPSSRLDVRRPRGPVGTHKYAGEGIAPRAQALLVGIHASQDAGQKGAMALPTRGLRAYDVFGTCKPHNPVSRNPSTVSILLSELQAEPVTTQRARTLEIWSSASVFNVRRPHVKLFDEKKRTENET